MKFIVQYVENSSDQQQSFDTRSEAETFIADFLNKHKDNTDDNWMRHVFYGMELEYVTKYKAKIKGPKKDA